MHVLLRDDLADRQYLTQFTDFDAEVEAHLLTRTPEWAAGITGLSVAEIEAFAHLVGKTPRTYFRLGYGFTRQRNGSANMHAALCIPAVSGAWRHRGGGAFHSNSGTWKLDKSLITGTGMGKAGRELDMSEIGKVLTGDSKALKQGGPVKALFIQNTNPMNVSPEQGLTRAGFAREDLFTVVHEQFMTETAEMADIVLPATMFLEHNDYYTRGGHTRVLFGPKLVEAPGECRSNFEVVNELLRRLGHRRSVAASDRPADGRRDLPQVALSRSRRGRQDRFFVDRARPDDEARFANGFGWSGQEVPLPPELAGRGRPQGLSVDHRPGRCAQNGRLVGHQREDRRRDVPFRLATSPSRGFLNSIVLRDRRQPKAAADADGVHPLRRRRGAMVSPMARRCGSAITAATVELTARIFEGMQQGVLIAEGIHPNKAHGTGQGINTLIGSDQVPPFGGVAFHDAAVWIEAAD